MRGPPPLPPLASPSRRLTPPAARRSNTPSTFLLSLLVSILAFLPLAIALPPSGTAERFAWLRLWSTLSCVYLLPSPFPSLLLVLPSTPQGR